MRKKVFNRLFVFVCVAIIFQACSKDKDKIDEKDVPTDYSVADNWLYVSGTKPTKPVDVFFAYPTTYSGNENYCAVTNEGMRAGARDIRNKYATVFEEEANLYMPYYRQMSATYALTLSPEKQDEVMRAIPGADVISAFKYYLEYYSDGRPFMLAGHSQGSNSLLYVLEYIKDEPQLLDRLVCAYIIGYSVTTDFLAANVPLTFATGRTDLGVIVSWNTESPGVTDENPVVEPGAQSINPITWTTEETHANESLSLGARLETSPGVFEKVEHFADAQVDHSRGVIICSTVNPEDYKIPVPIFPLGVLHGCDYPFYYYDIQQNVADRIDAYFSR